MKKKVLTYKVAGVDYHAWDFVKRMAQNAGLKTSAHLTKHGYREVIKSRGESAYIVDLGDVYLAMVEEGLGTKNIVADQFRSITRKTYYDTLAQDTVAMMVNDLITVGARPVSILAYWSIGNSNWFEDKSRTADLINGWQKACDLSRASWGGGETPTMKDVVVKDRIELAGAAVGMIKPKNRLILGDDLKAGDAIIFLQSSGIHANGLTLARKIADQLPNKYATKIPGGGMYGADLLKPTIIYSQLIMNLLDEKVDIHYMANITGHGWKKLMRCVKPLRYVIDVMPHESPLFLFIQKKSGLTDSQMYETFNMGAGFALFINSTDTGKAVEIARKNNINAWIAGCVEKGPRRVEIKPLGITYFGKELEIR